MIKCNKCKYYNEGIIGHCTDCKYRHNLIDNFKQVEKEHPMEKYIELGLDMEFSDSDIFNPSLCGGAAVEDPH